MKPKINACVEFGGFLRSVRIKNQIPARLAARGAGILPSNFSKLEHGALAPPKDGAKQKLLADSVGIKTGSPEAARFFDLAATATDTVPIDIADIISADEAVPILLRTIGNKRLSRKDIERLVAIVRGTTDDKAKETNT